MQSILIVDDHAVVRTGVRHVLQAAFPNVHFGEAETVAEAMKLLRKRVWSVVVMDIALPGRGGLDALKDIKAEYPALPVLIHSMYAENQYAIRAIRSGAAGYITKAATHESLVGAIRKILGGGKYISESLGEALAANVSRETEAPLHEELSDREYQVLRLIGGGKSVKEIGFQLSLGIKTVSTYRSRVMLKLKLNSTAELIRYALLHQIVE